MGSQVRRTDVSDQAERITPRADKSTPVIHCSSSELIGTNIGEGKLGVGETFGESNQIGRPS